MEIKGTMYHCDNKGCSGKIFLEDGEDITDMEWCQIVGEGLYCEECGQEIAQRVKAERRAEDACEAYDRIREERMIEEAA